MRPDRSDPKLRRHSQLGLGLISALALVVLVSVIAAGLVSLMRSETAAVTTAVLELRARTAAESGVEAGLNRLFAPRGVSACTDQTISFNLAGLRGCSATVSCDAVDVQAVRHYDFVSEGRCLGSGSEAAVARLAVRSTAP